MKRIALITNHDDDVFCFRKELLEELYNQKNEIIISCPYGEKLDLLDFKYEYDNPSIDRRGINPLKDLKLLIHYFIFLKKYKPDIVLNYTIKPNVYASIACRIKKVEYINNVTGVGSILNKGNILQAFIYKLLRFAFKKSKCVFFQNETNMKLIIKKGLINGNYKLIPGSGVNVDRYPLQDYPTNDKKIIFNYIGRVLSEKGIDDYIEAAKIIKEKGYNAEFNVIGFVEPTEDHYVKEFKQLEQEHIIKYWGQQKDIKPFIKKSHAIIHPSKYGEGMSNVLLENASSGRPLITTNNPGCFETVEDGKTGFIYEKGNVSDLVQKIEKFINLKHDDKIKMGIAGRKKMEKDFNRKIVINSYINCINGNNDCLFVHDFRGYLINNEIYSTNLSYDIIKKRYLSVFNNLTICNRILANKYDTYNKNKYVQTSGPNVFFEKEIGNFSTPLVLLSRRIKKIIKKNIYNNEFVIIRLDSFLGLIAAKICRKAKKKYLIECAGCAWDSFWNHGLLGKMIAPYMYYRTRKEIKRAPYVIYVTKSFLEKRYPTSGKFINCSNVEIEFNSEFELKQRLQRIEKNKRFINICTIGATNVRYKGQQYVIKALGILKRKNKNHFKYYIIGGGDNSYLKKIAIKNNVLENVIFVGALSHKEVINKLRDMDIYIQPSLQEGLPRSLIEAMALGNYCLGSNTAGIPELLKSNRIIKKGIGFSNRISKKLLNISKEDYVSDANDNINESKNYYSKKLNMIRSKVLNDFKNNGGIQ